MKTDLAWKKIIEALFPQFVSFFMPDLYELIDFSIKPKSLDNEFGILFPESKSENRRVDKLFEVHLKDGKSKWVLLNINSAHGIYEHTLDEVEMIQAYIQEQAGEDCDVIFGTGFDDNLGENISVTIIATGFEYKQSNHEHTAERMKPHFDKTKVTMTLGKEGEENKLFDTPSDQANATPMASLVIENVEPEKSHDPLAPMMIEIEEPAIPSFMSIGFGMSNRKVAQVNNIQNEVEELILEMPELSVEAASFVAEYELPEVPEIENIPMEFYQPEDEVKEIFTLQAEDLVIESKQEIIYQEEKIVFELSPEVEIIQEEEFVAKVEEAQDVNVQAELDALFSSEANTPPSSEPIVMKEVEKTEQQMQDDYVTIKGITLNRKKGNRYLSDTELEAEANFELQKRAFDERASRLRSMSFNVNNADIDKDESNIPAYLRQNKVLDTHPASGDDVYSNINVNSGNNGAHISTLNTFLNGKRPD